MKTELNIYTGLVDSSDAAVQPITVLTMMALMTLTVSSYKKIFKVLSF